MVKRDLSSSSEVFPPQFSNILSASLSQAFGFLGVGALGLSIFEYEKFPLSFYAISLVFSIILYKSSSYLISRLSNHAKIASVVGVAALNGRGSAFFAVLSIFAALVVISGISLSLSYFSTLIIIFNLGKSPASWTVALILGVLYASVILFLNKRAILFPWARYGLITILTGITIAKLVIPTEGTNVLEYASQSFDAPSFEIISLPSLKEFITATCIFLLALFSGSILDPSILKAKSGSSEKSTTYSALMSGMLSSSIAFLYFMMLLTVQNESIYLNIFDETVFLNIYLKTIVGILFTISLVIQSMEYFDAANTIGYAFFKPIFEEQMTLLNVVYVREPVMLAFMFSVSYYTSGNILLSFGIFDISIFAWFATFGIFNVSIYALCFAILTPFLIMPAIELIKRSRKLSAGLSIGAWFGCILCGAVGSALMITYLFGLGSLQHARIFKLMLENTRITFCLLIVCALIYVVFVILDVLFYPPKDNYPINHIIINLSDAAPAYGKNYSAEFLIIFCVIATLSPSLKSIGSLPASNFVESGLLYFADLILRIFIHSGIIHLALNCLSIYRLGKKLSQEIGPCHFICFFLVAGILSEMLENILYTHIYSIVIKGTGASGIVFALLARYLFIDGMRFKMNFFTVTSHEFVVYSIVLSIFFILSGLLSSILHISHLSGLIFGMFFWDLSEQLWKLRNPIYKRLFSKKK